MLFLLLLIVGFIQCNIYVIQFVRSILIFTLFVFIVLRLSLISGFGRYCYEVRFSFEDVGFFLLWGVVLQTYRFARVWLASGQRSKSSASALLR